MVSPDDATDTFTDSNDVAGRNSGKSVDGSLPTGVPTCTQSGGPASTAGIDCPTVAADVALSTNDGQLSEHALTVENPGGTTNVEVRGPGQCAGPTRFLGDYEVFEELARGGMGIVYRARQVHLGRIVALKLVRDASLATYAEIRRFRKEAEAVAELDHPNIVPIYEVGQTEDQPYFSMKLIDGGNLTRHIGRLRDRPRAAAALMGKVARAVHYAHQHAILHRDLKPSNILLGDGDEPYVTDFGLAKRIDPGSVTVQTVTGAVMGTPAYMPPEQAGGGSKSLTTAADIYSLGATLYETLTGQPPFAGDSVADILRRVIDQDPVPPRTLNPRVDRDLETICLKCLEKSPARRYGTAEDLALDLERWLDGRPITARSVKAWERAVKWARRRRALSSLLALSTISLVALIVVWFYLTRDLKTALDLAYRDRYSSDMNLARRAWDDGEVYRVREYLEKYRDPEGVLARYRSFEWYYLWKLCDQRLLTLNGHTGNILSVAYSPDSVHLATGGSDSTVRLWEPERKEIDRLLEGHTGSVGALAFRPNGQLLASGSADGTVRLWNVATGECRRPLPVGAKVNCLVFSPDGRFLAVMTTTEDRVAFWDVESGQKQFELGPDGPPDSSTFNHNMCKFSPDGSRLYVTDHQAHGVTVWDVAGRRAVRTLSHGAIVRSLSLTSDGRWLVTFTTQSSIFVWNASSFEGNIEKLWPTGGMSGVNNNNVQCSPLGRLVAFSSSRMERTELWDLDFRRRTDSFPIGFSGAGQQCLTFRPDGRRLAIARADEVVVASVVSGQSVPDVVSRPGLGIRALAVRDAGTRVAWAAIDDPRVIVWDAQKHEPIGALSGHEMGVLALDYGPPKRPDLLASAGADGQVRLWDADRDGASLHVLSGHVGVVQDVAFLPDGQTLVSAGADGTGRIWDVDTGRAVHVIDAHAGPLKALAVAPGGRYVAATGGNGSIVVWDAHTGTVALDSLYLDGIANDVAFSADGTSITAGGSTSGSGGTVAIWDATSGALLNRWITPSAVQAIVFSHDGRRVITAGAESALVVWDTSTGRETIALEGHKKPVLTLVTAPGLRLYSAGLDGTVRIWEGLDPGPSPPPLLPVRNKNDTYRTRRSR